MITAPTAAPAMNTAFGPSDHRLRPVVAERTILPDSTPATPEAARAGEDGSFAQQASAEPLPQEDKDHSAMFAAAVISGALRPTPQTMEELMIRIGSSTIPEEFEARLKDLLA
jgi:hypothetical protein